jgi:hypothetical protein
MYAQWVDFYIGLYSVRVAGVEKAEPLLEANALPAKE